jgi:hypothetical protein
MCVFVKTMAVRISLKVFGGSCSPVPFKFQIKMKIMNRGKASSIAYLLTAVVKPTLKLHIASHRNGFGRLKKAATKMQSNHRTSLLGCQWWKRGRRHNKQKVHCTDQYKST